MASLIGPYAPYSGDTNWSDNGSGDWTFGAGTWSVVPRAYGGAAELRMDSPIRDRVGRVHLEFNLSNESAFQSAGVTQIAFEINVMRGYNGIPASLVNGVIDLSYGGSNSYSEDVDLNWGNTDADLEWRKSDGGVLVDFKAYCVDGTTAGLSAESINFTAFDWYFWQFDFDDIDHTGLFWMTIGNPPT